MFCVQLVVTACGICAVVFRLLDLHRNIGTKGLAEFTFQTILV